MKNFDKLSRDLLQASKTLGLVLQDEFVVLPEELRALRRVETLVLEWSLSDRRTQ